MIINDKINLPFLYSNGFYQSHIPKEDADAALAYIEQESWVEDQEASSIIYNPTWDTGKSVDKKEIPEFYQNFLNRFLSSGFLKNYNELFGEFTASNAAINKCPKGYINRWHGHFMDGYHIHLLFHFSKEERKPEDGGFMEFGLILDPAEYYVDLETYNQRDLNNVFRTGSFMSSHGQFEVLLNSHPMYSHQVTEVLSDKTRYTLMFFLGYEDNILKSKEHINNI